MWSPQNKARRTFSGRRRLSEDGSLAVEKEKVVAADDNQTVCYLDSFLEREAPRSKAIRDLVASSVPTALVVAPWKGVPNRHRRWGQD